MAERITYREGNYKYVLWQPYTVQTSIYPRHDITHPFIVLRADGMLTIKHHYAWDGPSGPTIDSKCAMRASLIHDALIQLVRMRVLDGSWKTKIDRLFYHILREDGMLAPRAWMWYVAVRIGWHPGERERPVLEAP